jgi:hypothetical protein
MLPQAWCNSDIGRTMHHNRAPCWCDSELQLQQLTEEEGSLLCSRLCGIRTVTSIPGVVCKHTTSANESLCGSCDDGRLRPLQLN